ncbi:unnamed protein product [Calypogeia fissa]
MSRPIVLQCLSSGEIPNVNLRESSWLKYVSKIYINQRFGLPVDDFVYRVRGKTDGFVIESIFQENVKHWELHGGSLYQIECHSDQAPRSLGSQSHLPKEEKGKAQFSDATPASLPFAYVSQGTKAY